MDDETADSTGGHYNRSLRSETQLFPLPSDHPTGGDYTLNRSMRSSELDSYKMQIEIRLVSPIECSMESLKNNMCFKQIFDEMKQKPKIKEKQLFVVNVKHYTHIISRFKHNQEDLSMVVNYNPLDRDLMATLAANWLRNYNIITFIECSDRGRREIIASLEDDPLYAKIVRRMTRHNMFKCLTPEQMVAFYTAVIRDGRCVLCDAAGNTQTAMTIMAYYRNDWPLVVVCNSDRRKVWYDKLRTKLNFTDKLKISVCELVGDIYVYPKPFHDIIVMDYDLYNEVKDTISFRCLNIKSLIFEDQLKGKESTGHKHWKNLSTYIGNLANAKRIIFICNDTGFDLNAPKSLWPILRILDPKTYEDYDTFHDKYCDDSSDEQYERTLLQLEILLRSTLVIPVAFVPENS